MLQNNKLLAAGTNSTAAVEAAAAPAASGDDDDDDDDGPSGRKHPERIGNKRIRSKTNQPDRNLWIRHRRSAIGE